MSALLLRHALSAAAYAACLVLVPLALVAQPDFGDNTSRWADDGECDDPRFAGEGAAATLLDEDRGHDAADCRKLFETGRLTLRGTGALMHDATEPGAGGVDFGDDASEWARDGECDDPRFAGDGMAETLLDADAYHDATDCRALLEEGRIALFGNADNATVWHGRLEKGDDRLRTGEYADAYTFTGAAGERALIELRSGDFDPYLFVRAPSGEQFDNDDFEGDASRSQLSLELVESGEYRVMVTSYDKGETGGYSLSIDVGPSAAPIERDSPTRDGKDLTVGGRSADEPGRSGIVAYESSLER